jgi:UDP-GlcNAc:undecaprenyl-phosphate GlcNAc-1-phosphate transferase
MISFYLFGIYRGLWMYVAFRDIVRIVQAAFVGTLSSMIVLFLFTFFEGYSISVMIVYFLLLVFFVSARLASLRGFKEYFTHHKAKSADRGVIIFGAGDSGNAVLKEILNNEVLNLRPLGFIDDDVNKVGLKINGVEVLGTRGELKRVIEERGAEEVIIAVRNIPEESILDIQKMCIDLGISYRRAAGIL